AMKQARGRPYFYTGSEDGNQIYILIRLGNGVSG
ncbi:PAS:GGDEF protein, partial [Pseudomonas syringae pv. pisi str. 1704B]